MSFIIQDFLKQIITQYNNQHIIEVDTKALYPFVSIN